MKDYPEILSDAADVLKRHLLIKQIEPSEAHRIAYEVIESLRQHWGGQQIYIPKAIGITLTGRDREICSRFEGRNFKELCDEYGLTEFRLRQIIRAGREEEHNRRQLGMFNKEDA